MRVLVAIPRRRQKGACLRSAERDCCVALILTLRVSCPKERRKDGEKVKLANPRDLVYGRCLGLPCGFKVQFPELGTLA